MIYGATYMYLGTVNVAPFGKAPKLVNTFEVLKQMLENTTHSIVWIITTDQMRGFREQVGTYNLGKYIAYEMPYFVTNRNYPDKGRRMKLVIMKGKPE
jgi:hypothetical protein